MCYTNFVILITITIIIINIPAGLKGNCYGGTAGVASNEERKARIEGWRGTRMGEQRNIE